MSRATDVGRQADRVEINFLLSVLTFVLYQVPYSLEATATVKAGASVGTPSRRRLTGQGGRVARI